MTKSDFEGSLVLEKLAEISKVEEFFDAVDKDDFSEAESLMKIAGLDKETIQTVLKMMEDADGEH